MKLRAVVQNTQRAGEDRVNLVLQFPANAPENRGVMQTDSSASLNQIPLEAAREFQHGKSYLVEITEIA